MPRIKYRRYSPTKLARGVIETADRLLLSYTAQGLDLTLRQLHYLFVARDLYPEEWIDEEYNRKMGLDLNTKNTQKNYKRLGNLIAAAREGGMLDWDHIKDRGRSVSAFPHWQDPTHFIDSVTRQFALDMWEDQPVRVECLVEKDALSQVVENACDPYDVPTLATKGYLSASTAWDAGHNRYLRWAQKGQKIVILHLADHDPSGVHMSEDLAERLATFAATYRDSHQRCEIVVKRIALTMAQVEEYDPPPNPAKESDTRKPAYVAQFGVEESWELDALDPPVLISLIQEHIREELDIAKYEARRALETEYRDGLVAAAENWEELVEYMRESGLVHRRDDDEEEDDD